MKLCIEEWKGLSGWVLRSVRGVNHSPLMYYFENVITQNGLFPVIFAFQDWCESHHLPGIICCLHINCTSFFPRHVLNLVPSFMVILLIVAMSLTFNAIVFSD